VNLALAVSRASVAGAIATIPAADKPAGSTLILDRAAMSST